MDSLPNQHARRKARHICDLSCGIFDDPSCPVWAEAYRQNEERDAATRRRHRVEALAERLGLDVDELREVLLDLLGDVIAEQISQTIADELPDAMAALRPGGRR